MTDGEALLAAILADPSDDTARLVYADWLEENGELARAEFIRVQCELARLGSGPGSVCFGCSGDVGALSTSGPNYCVHCAMFDVKYDTRHRHFKVGKPSRGYVLQRREQELLGTHAAFHGNGPAIVEMPRKGWRRGFLEHITCDWRWWSVHHEITKCQPVEKVMLTTQVESLEPIFERIEQVEPEWKPSPLMQMVDVLKVAWPKIEFELPPNRLREMHELTNRQFRRLIEAHERHADAPDIRETFQLGES